MYKDTVDACSRSESLQAFDVFAKDKAFETIFQQDSDDIKLNPRSGPLSALPLSCVTQGFIVRLLVACMHANNGSACVSGANVKDGFRHKTAEISWHEKQLFAPDRNIEAEGENYPQDRRSICFKIRGYELVRKI